MLVREGVLRRARSLPPGQHCVVVMVMDRYGSSGMVVGCNVAGEGSNSSWDGLVDSPLPTD